MRASRFTEEQIRYAVQHAEAGVAVPELCRKYGALTKSELAG
jgi:Transposase